MITLTLTREQFEIMRSAILEGDMRLFNRTAFHDPNALEALRLLDKAWMEQVR